MRIRSLTSRSLALTTFWCVVALVVIAFVISALYKQAAERGFRQLLQAEMYNVINSVSINHKGELAGSPQLGDLRYQQPSTGWYWVVDPLYAEGARSLTSPSLGSGSLPTAADAVPYDGNFRRSYVVHDGKGNNLTVLETTVVLDDDGRTARFRVTGNRKAVEEDVRWFSRRLYLALALFGVASILVNALAILWALKPLDETQRALSEISETGEGNLAGAFPAEIQPLVDEINALLANNRAIVERARMQVGNLAHSLKTPIAVLVNEAQEMDEKQGKLITSQVGVMQAQVTAYLNRARIAAQSESVLTRCDVLPTLERLRRVMRRLNPDLEFELSCDEKLVAMTEQQDLEEVIGNLLENAGRFATEKVSIVAGYLEERQGGHDKSWIEIRVEDDGPGLTPDQIKRAMKRGQRLDENGPGAGLGLSIVDDIVNAYGGSFELSGLAGSGLRARVVLPGKRI
ncbi:HAMP domain-containing histidine kinase [Martelella alba]|uniref:histidine kinase n=1 Tax=Martelella alba TaxID=2590451 RepID=A0A506UCQ1_9HYPH|nr:HAMP domain-containing sensor histidine kinase [Martelella alba]TPW29527.1 HAMP domain-containing histidine kinase [Martelella alba]